MDATQQPSTSPSKKRHTSKVTIVLSFIFVFIVGMLTGWSINWPIKSPQNTKQLLETQRSPTAAYPTPTISSLEPPKLSGERITYVSQSNGVRFNYPKGWALSIERIPYFDKEPEPEDYSFKASADEGDDIHFIMNIGLNAWGIGGACPGYDPKQEVAKSEKIRVLGTDLYVIFHGDNTKKIVDYAYLSANPTGECPNIPFASIPGLPRFFSTSFSFTTRTDEELPLPSQSFITNVQIQQAIQILQSLQFLK